MFELTFNGSESDDDYDYDQFDFEGVVGSEDELVEAGVVSEETIEQERRERIKNTGAVSHDRITVDSLKIPQRRIPEILAGYDCVVVHDYDDMYHKSEEERLAESKFYKLFNKMQRMKHKYRDIYKYISALRQAFECLDAVADGNEVYSPEKFKKKFYKGDIYINGLKFPKYVGKDKKEINWAELYRFVMSDQDPRNWGVGSKCEDDDEFMSPEESLKLFCGSEDIDGLVDTSMSQETFLQVNMFHEGENYDPSELQGLNVAVPLDPKDIQSIDRVMIRNARREIKRAENDQKRLDSMIFELTEDDWNKIDRYDRKNGVASELPEFNGNVMKTSDVNKYMFDVSVYEGTLKENYNGKLITRQEAEELRIKDALAANDINILQLYDNKREKEELRKIKEREDRKVKNLKKRLSRLEERRDRRIGQMTGEKKVKSKKKKKQKKEDD